MSYFGQPGVRVVGDASVSELVEQWVGEQVQRGGAASRARPRIGLVAYSSMLRDGGWPVYGADAPTAQAILEAGGFPCLIPLLPLLEGYDPLQVVQDDHTFALFFDLLWPLVRDLDGLVLSGGGDLSACFYGQQPHPQSETPDLWRDVWERYLALLSWVLCLPTLGICRGMQLMNVALGGTTYQDLSAEQADVPPEQRRRYLVLIDEFQVYRNANYQGMLAELRKYGGSFALATQSLAYLDRLDRTLRATVLANIDHLFAFHMAGEDARLLHELDGILEEDVTSLDDFQCYVKLSLGGHRLPVFSLALDAPPLPDEQLAQFVRLRSRGRDARPAGAVDELIKQSQARQRSAAPIRGRAPVRIEDEGEHDQSGTGSGSAHRHKKRGSGSQRTQEERAAPVHLHLMYCDQGEDVTRSGEEDGERGNADV